MENENQNEELNKKELEQLDKIIEKLVSVKEYLNNLINYIYF